MSARKLSREPWESLRSEERLALQEAWALLRKYPEFGRVRMAHWAERCGCHMTEMILILRRLMTAGWVDFQTDCSLKRIGR